MKVAVGALAKEELIAGCAWYDEQRHGLGDRFKAEVLAAIERIIAYPGLYTELAPGIRRALVKGFPYMIIYAAGEGLIEIIAVAHLHRRPGYWS